MSEFIQTNLLSDICLKKESKIISTCFQKEWTTHHMFSQIPIPEFRIILPIKTTVSFFNENFWTDSKRWKQNQPFRIWKEFLHCGTRYSIMGWGFFSKRAFFFLYTLVFTLNSNFNAFLEYMNFNTQPEIQILNFI